MNINMPQNQNELPRALARGYLTPKIWVLTHILFLCHPVRQLAD
jgi:hypothetical protein